MGFCDGLHALEGKAGEFRLAFTGEKVFNGGLLKRSRRRLAACGPTKLSRKEVSK